MKFKTNQKISRLKHQINSIYMSLGQTADIFPILITILRSYFIINMNFDNDDAIDSLIGRLIAFIIMFEKKIENIKCKIAGSQRFHTRLAFQVLDLFKKNEIDTECLFRTLGNTKFQEKQASCGLFLRKYSKNNAITYDEFLKLLAPKGNRALSQGMLIRTYQKGTALQASLWEWVLELLQLYIKMCSVTESIRIAIQQSEDLSYLQLIEFFSLTIKSGSSLINFMNRCSTQNQEYDIEAEDAVYLSYHLKSGHQLSDFTDIDIKQLLFPLNHSFQKQNTTQTTFYKQTMHPKTVQQNQTKQINFLGKTYQKMFHNKEAQNGKFSKKQNLDSSGYTIVNSNRLASVSNPTSRVDKSYGALYIDNFTRSGLNPVLELNQFIAENRENKKEVEFFHDDLNSNYSSLSRQSKESAFDRS